MFGEHVPTRHIAQRPGACEDRVAKGSRSPGFPACSCSFTCLDSRAARTGAAVADQARVIFHVKWPIERHSRKALELCPQFFETCEVSALADESALLLLIPCFCICSSLCRAFCCACTWRVPAKGPCVSKRGTWTQQRGRERTDRDVAVAAVSCSWSHTRRTRRRMRTADGQRPHGSARTATGESPLQHNAALPAQRHVAYLERRHSPPNCTSRRRHARSPARPAPVWRWTSHPRAPPLPPPSGR